eukprot:592209-Amphidinium_carterae.1
MSSIPFFPSRGDRFVLLPRVIIEVAPRVQLSEPFDPTLVLACVQSPGRSVSAVPLNGGSSHAYSTNKNNYIT